MLVLRMILHRERGTVTGEKIEVRWHIMENAETSYPSRFRRLVRIPQRLA